MNGYKKKAKKVAKGKHRLINDQIAKKALGTENWGRVALRVGVDDPVLPDFKELVLKKFMEEPNGVFKHYKGIEHDEPIETLTKKTLDKHLEQKEYAKIDALLKQFSEWEKEREIRFELPYYNSLTERLVAELPEDQRQALIDSDEVDFKALDIDPDQF